ncbi:hypothetical protein [Mesorhizobium sp.]|uniref:hypothetical protein n=1 Tax=Mesorhizobium sp. TaxID=1871066 RepID=UPI000FE52513|nr:hypothetical protein [Mesorhizobium sp.]RWO23313.1 MAG: hypothetical protein EOS09_16945 [Mesorhizobium sp.]
MVDHPDEYVQARWHWRNCRSVGFGFALWLWPWAIGVYREDDVFGGERGVHFGPIGFSISYSIGNRSSSGLDRFTGLSDAEAYDRAARYEGRDIG